VSDAILVALIVAASGIFNAWMTRRSNQKIDEVHAKIAEVEIKVDGRLTQLLEITAARERAVGHEEGRLTEIGEQTTRDEAQRK